MAFQVQLLLLCITGPAGLKVAVERELGINNNVTFSRQVDDNIRLFEFSPAVTDGNLCFKLRARTQTGFFQQFFQHHFAPLSLELVLALQSPGKVNRILTYPFIEIFEVLNLFDQGYPVPRFPVIDIFHSFPEAIKLFPYRL